MNIGIKPFPPRTTLDPVIREIVVPAPWPRSRAARTLLMQEAVREVTRALNAYAYAGEAI